MHTGTPHQRGDGTWAVKMTTYGFSVGNPVLVRPTKGRDYVTKITSVDGDIVDVVKLKDLPYTFSADMANGNVVRVQIRVHTQDEAVTVGYHWLRDCKPDLVGTLSNHRANRPRGKAAQRMRKKFGLEDEVPQWRKERGESSIPEPKVEDKPEPKAEVVKSEPIKAKLPKGSIESIISDLVDAKMASFQPSVDEDTVLGLIEDAVNAIVTPVTVVEIHKRGEVVKQVEQAHKQLPRALSYAQRYGNVFLAGPAGCGKGVLGRQLAESLDSRFGQLSLSEGVSEGQLTGRGVPLAESFKYIEAQFVNFFENGGVFMLDEVDAADPNVLLVINEALANGTLSVPNREEQPTAERHEDFILLVAANTWGTGPDAQYTGRNRLDAAFLDRFAGAAIYMDYDHALEESIVASIVKDADKRQGVLALWHSIRRGIRQAGLRRVWSTRGLKASAIAVQDGDTLEDVLDAHTVTWPEHDRKQVAEFAKL